MMTAEVSGQNVPAALAQDPATRLQILLIILHRAVTQADGAEQLAMLDDEQSSVIGMLHGIQRLSGLGQFALIALLL